MMILPWNIQQVELNRAILKNVGKRLADGGGWRQDLMDPELHAAYGEWRDIRRQMDTDIDYYPASIDRNWAEGDPEEEPLAPREDWIWLPNNNDISRK